MDKISEEKGLQKVANHLGEQMSKLIRVKSEEPNWKEKSNMHKKSKFLCDHIYEVNERIARQRQWLRSNLNASPEEKKKVKSRLDEMKKAKSELIDEYTQLQLP